MCIIYERSISFLTILKIFKISGLQTKMVFIQSFKYLKNEHILFYICRAIFTQTNPKKSLIEKKTCQIQLYRMMHLSFIYL